MTHSIKTQILQLPDSEIQPLLEWLRGYYDGEVWDRQMDADIERLGEGEWMRRLGQAPKGDREAAALRLLNAIEPCSEDQRVRFAADLALLMGEPPDTPRR